MEENGRKDERNINRALNFERIFRVTAEITSIILIIGFLLSASLNHLVFADWGLGFLMVANPSDVIMSGLAFLFDTITSLFIGFFLVVIIFLFYIGSEKGTVKRRNALVGTTALLALISMISFIIGIPLDTNIEAMARGKQRTLESAFDGTIASLVSGAASLFFAISVFSSNENWRLWKMIVLVLSGLIGTVTAYYAGSSLITLRSDLGYYSQYVVVAEGQPDTCGSSPTRLLWSGATNAVITCGSGQTQTILVTSMQNLTFSPRTRALICDGPDFKLRWECEFESPQRTLRN